MNLFAFTEPGGNYPGYVSINRVENGVQVTVRAKPKFYQIPGYPAGCVEVTPGEEATLTIPIDTPEAVALETLPTTAVEPGESEVERREALMEFAWSYEHEGETCFAVDIEDAIAALARLDRDAIEAETVAAIVERCAKVARDFERQENDRAYDKRQAGRDDNFNCARASAARHIADAIERGDWRNSAALQVKP